MRRASIVVMAVALVTAGLAGEAAAVIPKNAVYQGIVDGSANTNGHNEREGYFRVRGTADTKRIVAPGDFACGSATCSIPAILPPTAPPCNATNAYLEATRIPITAGAFDYLGKANIGPSGARMNIRFKGSWRTATTVKGFTRIWNASCDSGKAFWTMSTPPPP